MKENEREKEEKSIDKYIRHKTEIWDFVGGNSTTTL